jgi:hypothetical protein
MWFCIEGEFQVCPYGAKDALIFWPEPTGGCTLIRRQVN